MLGTCQQHVEMLMNLGIFACGCQHQNSPDIRFLCQKLPTLYSIPECTYSQRSNVLPKILTLETDSVQSDATFVIAIEPHHHHNSSWSCSAPPPPVITSCRFDIHFDCCVCSHFTGQHSVHPLCSLTCCAPPKPDGFKSTFTTPSACTKQGKGTSTSTSIANAASQSCYASIHRANSLNTHHCRPHQ